MWFPIDSPLPVTPGGSTADSGQGDGAPTSPVPSSPFVFSPQHTTDPSSRSTHVCSSPAAISTAQGHGRSPQRNPVDPSLSPTGVVVELVVPPGRSGGMLVVLLVLVLVVTGSRVVSPASSTHCPTSSGGERS